MAGGSVLPVDPVAGSERSVVVVVAAEVAGSVVDGSDVDGSVVSWIEKARKRGILSATTPGVMGGTVTATRARGVSGPR